MVEIRHGAYTAEVVATYPQDNIHYDDIRRLYPICHCCREELVSDGIDVFCTNVECWGVTQARTKEILEQVLLNHPYWKEYTSREDISRCIRFIFHRDAAQRFPTLDYVFNVDFLTTLFEPRLSDDAHFALMPIINLCKAIDGCLTHRDVTHDHQNAVFAAFLCGLGLPGFDPRDAYRMFQEEEDSEDSDPFSDYFHILRDENVLSSITGMPAHIAHGVVVAFENRFTEMVSLFNLFSYEDLRPHIIEDDDDDLQLVPVTK